MAIPVACSCGSRFDLKTEFAGRQVACPSCGATLDVPAIRGQAGSEIDRDKFLLHQKRLAINEKYSVHDEQDQPILFVERPTYLFRSLLATFGVLVVLIVGTVLTLLVPTLLDGVGQAGSPLGIALLTLAILGTIAATFFAAVSGGQFREAGPRPPVISADMLAADGPFRRLDFERGMRLAAPVTLGLIAACCATFVWQLEAGVLADEAALVRGGALVREGLLRGEVWRLVSSMFLHGDIGHLLGNMVPLFILGAACEHAFGGGKAAAIYLAAGLAGGVATAALDPRPTVGASGAVFGLMGCLVAVLQRLRAKVRTRDGRIAAVVGHQRRFRLCGPVGLLVDRLNCRITDRVPPVAARPATGSRGTAGRPRVHLVDRFDRWVLERLGQADAGVEGDQGHEQVLGAVVRDDRGSRIGRFRQRVIEQVENVPPAHSRCEGDGKPPPAQSTGGRI